MGTPDSSVWPHEPTPGLFQGAVELGAGYGVLKGGRSMARMALRLLNDGHRVESAGLALASIPVVAVGGFLACAGVCDVGREAWNGIKNMMQPRVNPEI